MFSIAADTTLLFVGVKDVPLANSNETNAGGSQVRLQRGTKFIEGSIGPIKSRSIVGSIIVEYSINDVSLIAILESFIKGLLKSFRPHRRVGVVSGSGFKGKESQDGEQS